LLISKNLKYAAGVGVISLAMLASIPGDPKNALLLGFSLSRLAMLVGLLGITVLLVTTHLQLKHQPDKEQSLLIKLQKLTNNERAQEAILFLAATFLLAGFYLLIELALTTDAQVQGILLRLAPGIFFIMGISALTLAFQPFSPARRRWNIILLGALLLAVLGRLGQEALLSRLERSLPSDADLVTISQALNAYLGFLLVWMSSRLSARERSTWIALAGLTVVLFLLQWEIYPRNYWRTQRNLALFAPAIIIAFSLLTRVVFVLWHRLETGGNRTLRRVVEIVALVSLILLAIPYYQAATQHSQVLNYSPEFIDQQEYLDFAKNARLLNFRYTGDHNRTPGYPFFQALFYQTGMSDQAFFEQGKQINILLSMALLAILFPIFRRLIPGLGSYVLLLIFAFSVSIFKAPYFQAETLFYFLFFLGYLGMLFLLGKPSAGPAAATGMILGLAHLVKASILPGLALFIGLFSLKELLNLLRPAPRSVSARAKSAPVLRHLAYLAVVMICFLAVIFPYIHAMKLRFGHYFYNVNTTFYVWYDDNFKAIEAEAQHHFADRWPSHLAEDEIPSLRQYFRTHSLQQVIDRVRFGLREQMNNLLLQYSVTNYHLSYLMILLFVILGNLRKCMRLAKRFPYRVGFSLLFFAVYLAAFVWYSPISPERRFTYSLFLPLMFSIFVTLDTINKGQDQEALKMGVDWHVFTRASHILIGLTLVINIWLVVNERMFFDRFGS